MKYQLSYWDACLALRRQFLNTPGAPRQVDQLKEPLTMRPPWTPLPRRLGAYSARSTDRNHSITLWLDHCTTSEGERLLCEREKESGEVRPTGPTRLLCGASLCESLALDASPRPTLMPTDPGLHASCLRTCLVSKKLSSHSTCRIFYSEISNSRIPLLPDSLVTSRLTHEDMELFIQ